MMDSLLVKKNLEIKKSIDEINARYKECFLDILTEHVRRDALKKLADSHYNDCFIATAKSVNPVLYGVGDILNKVAGLELFDKDKNYIIGDENGNN